MSEKMREAFESSRIDEGIDPEELWLDAETGDYLCDEQIYWQVWQAAWKASCSAQIITLPKGPTTLPTGDLLAVAEANAAHNMRKACKVAIEAAGLVVA